MRRLYVALKASPNHETSRTSKQKIKEKNESTDVDHRDLENILQLHSYCQSTLASCNSLNIHMTSNGSLRSKSDTKVQIKWRTKIRPLMPSFKSRF